MARFSDQQIRRYSRQILLREVGGRGQERLQAARPVLVCAGEVGQLTADYLWRAGVTGLLLLAATPELAARLGEQLAAAGYPGSPARALAGAPAEVQRLALGAPGFTLLWIHGVAGDLVPEAAPLLWACCRGAWGVVGQGAEALPATVRQRDRLGSVESGAGAMIVGSALALLALQRLLGVAGAADEGLQRQGAIWQLDLDSPAPPRWSP